MGFISFVFGIFNDDFIRGLLMMVFFGIVWICNGFVVFGRFSSVREVNDDFVVGLEMVDLGVLGVDKFVVEFGFDF